MKNNINKQQIPYVIIGISLIFMINMMPKKQIIHNRKTCFVVTKIDSILVNLEIRGDKNRENSHGVYIINARKNDSIYKIVSFRSLKGTRCIKEGKCYTFNVQSYLNLYPEQKHELGPTEQGFIINGVLVMADSASMYNLYYDTRLKGLCFTR